MKRKTLNVVAAVTVALIFGCSRSSDLPPAEKADQLYRQATALISSSQFVEAERCLTEAMALFTQTRNTSMLAECSLLLSSVQAQSGKLSSALQHLQSVRTLYKEMVDRTGEMQTLIEIGKQQARLGMNKESVASLEDAFLSSQLFPSPVHFARSAMLLGTVHARWNKHLKASAYYSQASAQFLKNNDLAGAVDANAGNIQSLLRIGETAAAAQYFSQTETILINNASAIALSPMYTTLGYAFLNTAQWEPARSCFEKALEWNAWNAQTSFTPMTAHLGLGELFFRNFSFTEAQQHFLKAYALAKSEANWSAQAFLLIRIADCRMRKASGDLSQEESILVTQLYEQAQNLYYRSRFPAGEAIALHRLGMVKQSLFDDNAAVTLYKRAFDKFSTAFTESFSVSPPVDPSWLMQTEMTPNSSAVRWFGSRLIALLLEQRKYADALVYVRREQSLRWQQALIDADLSFRQPEKDSLFSLWKRKMREKMATAAEMQFLLKGTDNEYLAEVQRRYHNAKNEAASASSALQKRYPEFGFLGSNSVPAQTIPEFATVLAYYFTRDALWIFALQRAGDVQAFRVKGSGLSAAAAMKKYMTALSGEVKISAREQLSQDLYSLLLAPIEKTGQQRFIIIPPDGFEKFPFHALEKNGRPLIDLIEVSYLPSLGSITPQKPLPSIISTVAAFGFSADARWGLEFELRDIRSFFRNARIFVNKTATQKNIESVVGEAIQISSLFQTDSDGESYVVLSNETPSMSGTAVPITRFASMHPAPVVQMYDVQNRRNNITPFHSFLWLANGSSAVITNEFPLTPRTTKKFGELFYSSYANGFDPFAAYRASVREMYRHRGNDVSPESYFYYGM